MAVLGFLAMRPSGQDKALPQRRLELVLLKPFFTRRVLPASSALDHRLRQRRCYQRLATFVHGKRTVQGHWPAALRMSNDDSLQRPHSWFQPRTALARCILKLGQSKAV